MFDRTKLLQLNDQELLIRIKDNSDYLGVVYKRCKPNCINFMRKITNGSIPEYDLEDVFQDASIILHEKIIKGNFVLTCAFQTYLNSVCRFQLLNTIGKNKITTEYQENSTSYDDEDPMGYISTIIDTLDEIEDYKEDLFRAMEISLEKMKAAGGKCYDLIIQFWYKKRSMKELSEIFEYTNAANTKNQKARCQEKLRVMSFNELKEI